MIVMPSREDSLPLVALEAASLARPIVATRVGGLPEILADQQTGLLVDKENIAALGSAILSLLGEPATAVRMGEAARKRIKNLFDWQRHVEAYDILYRNLVTT
jgi:glycosyltransferase involved in cell wall biosynthesis